jgi:hypothetical protein
LTAALVDEQDDQIPTGIRPSQGCIKVLPCAMPFLNKAEVSSTAQNFSHLVLSGVVLVLQSLLSAPISVAALLVYVASQNINLYAFSSKVITNTHSGISL